MSRRVDLPDGSRGVAFYGQPGPMTPTVHRRVGVYREPLAALVVKIWDISECRWGSTWVVLVIIFRYVARSFRSIAVTVNARREIRREQRRETLTLCSALYYVRCIKFECFATAYRTAFRALECTAYDCKRAALPRLKIMSNDKNSLTGRRNRRRYDFRLFVKNNLQRVNIRFGRISILFMSNKDLSVTIWEIRKRCR